MRTQGEGWRAGTATRSVAVPAVRDPWSGWALGPAVMLGALCAALMLAWCLFPGVASGASRCEDEEEPGGAIYEVSVNANAKTAPATDGELVAWGEQVGGTWGIWVKRLRSGDSERGWYEAEQLVSCTSEPSSISWAGSTIIWQEGASPSATIRACRLCGDAWDIATGAVGEPAAADGYAVWVDFSRDAAGDIVGTSLQSGDFAAVDVCVAPGAQRSPAVSDGLAVWQDKRDGDWDLWACALNGGGWLDSRVAAAITRCHPLTPGTSSVVCDAAGDQIDPAVWQNMIAWQDTRSGDNDIWAAWVVESVDEVSAVSMQRCSTGSLELVTGAVCTASGSQTAPTLSGPVVFWVDRRNGDADIRAYDLASQESGIVCDESGDQVAPSAGDDAVVWLDGRAASGVMDVYGADTWTCGEGTPPIAAEWTDEDVITLFLSVLYDLGVFDEVRFSTDGGETWGDWMELTDVMDLPLPDGEGTYVIALMLRGDDGEFGPVTFTVHIDKTAPKAKALGAIKAHKGRKATLRLRVRDNLSPQADVVLKIKDRKGKVVQRVVVEDVATGKKVVERFACKLARGTYKCTMKARDLAGNQQRKSSTVRMVVR